MKRILGKIKEETDHKVFGFEVLSENEMLKVKGGTKSKPKQKDLYDLEE